MYEQEEHDDSVTMKVVTGPMKRKSVSALYIVVAIL